MIDNISKLIFKPGQEPKNIGGMQSLEDTIGEVVSRRLISIKNNLALIQYNVRIPTPDDEYADARMAMIIEQYELDGENDDWSSLSTSDRLDVEKSNEEIFALFREVTGRSNTKVYNSITPRVIQAILAEMDYQKEKWGNKPQSLAGYLLILQSEIQEAIDGWMKNDNSPRNSPLEEIVQIAAVAISCLNKYGTTGITINTDDIKEETRDKNLVDVVKEVNRFKTDWTPSPAWGRSSLVPGSESFPLHTDWSKIADLSMLPEREDNVGFNDNTILEVTPKSSEGGQYIGMTYEELKQKFKNDKEYFG